jgi:hypothetical protein
MSEYRTQFREVERETFWSMPRVFLALLVAICFLYGIGFLATGGDLLIYRFWAPKMENAKREVFENTQSYVQGKTEYIGKLRYQYLAAEPNSAQQASLRMLILSEASTVDLDKLPYSLKAFVQSIGGQQ